MTPLSINAIGPATLSALGALRPVPAPTVPATPNGNAAGATALSIQDLAQGLFQRTLQSATLFPVAEPAAGSIGLAQQATASLLAALSAPQATATATPAPDAMTNPAAVQAPGIPPAPPPPATVLRDLPATQDAFATSSSLDFALQTALRFGAGVAAQAFPAPVAADLGAGLVRDAMAVPRIRNLQPHAGGPGPEAFARPEAAQRALRTYVASPAAQGSTSLDLMA
ncbi:MAG: hypothetical protein Q8K67_12835 [Geothrix sp.]|nr:hypothetical protein [Geothrix sp.]